ncbi:hypothetical protein PR202_ga31222 [Eleusine coracana subsp. coracana]|uniref:Reverse transcriptase zinc-binding domain-containing protein n=1 Tax=Eleusine coracana subsp. coracana TaxID=191504 RepID=A0AAV5DPL7_ELECO|nr:hypothetical protein PR202_ga31222 [Eleusine coracana subsp. coracana]
MQRGRILILCTVISEVGDGTRTLFWKDRWLHGKSIKEIAPLVYDKVPKRKANTRLVSDALAGLRWTTDIEGALSFRARTEYYALFELIEAVVLQPDRPDVHIWKLSSSGQYTVQSAYAALFQGATLSEPAERVWKSWAPGKCRFFMWLVQHDRC